MPARLFYSYSSKDEKLRERLETHLALLRRQGLIEPWSFRKILPGEDWEQEIDTNLEAADIIVLLISADFLASDYCYAVELKRALEKHAAKEATVIPIILRDCNWQSADFAKLQALPKGGKPVTKWSNRDSAWKDVEGGVRAVAVKYVGPATLVASPSPAQPTAPKHPVSTKASESTTLTFPDRASVDFDRYAVSFPIRINGRRAMGLISGEALQDYFRATSDDAGMLDAFKKHRRQIEKKARQLVAEGRLSSTGELMIRTSDFSRPHRRDISGKWRTRYFYFDDEGDQIVHNDVVTLKRRGTRVTGMNDAAEDHVYEIDGELFEGSLFSGNWRSIANPAYHGTFQLLLSADGNAMSGKWLGISHFGHVRHGEWTWQHEAV